ncbi:MAG: CopG family transcriptional regulator [Deltaproteobacteria bacterium]|nr:CopG family transcriptional regulator [Deltaproteobacteria bacterium]
MSKTVTLRLKENVYQAFVEAAQADNRPLSNLIETAAFTKIREQQFADDLEIAEIMANQDLLERMKKGSEDAKALKGDFIE